MKYSIAGVGNIELDTVILDLNGTIAVKGELVDGVKDRIDLLKRKCFSVHLLSGDQRGNAAEICETLGICLQVANSAQEKEIFVKNLSAQGIVAIGNARIDIGMFKHAALSICTLQGEGIHAEVLKHADILVTNINDALDLLLDGDSLKATMKI